MTRRLECEILAIFAAAGLYHYVELALTSEPSECCVEVCACKAGLLLKLALSHLSVCVEGVPDNACVVSDVVDFHNNQSVIDWVLGSLTADEIKNTASKYGYVYDGLLKILEGDVEEAMQICNGK